MQTAYRFLQQAEIGRFTGDDLCWAEESSGAGLWPTEKRAPETLEGKPLANKLTDEFKRIRNGNWKSIPLTAGVAVALVGGAVALLSWASKGEMTVKNFAAEAVQHHVDKDVDRAHPDLPGRYVQKRELKDAMHSVDRRLLNIETSQKVIIEKLDQADERRYTHRRTRGNNGR